MLKLHDSYHAQIHVGDGGTSMSQYLHVQSVLSVLVYLWLYMYHDGYLPGCNSCSQLVQCNTELTSTNLHVKNTCTQGLTGE